MAKELWAVNIQGPDDLIAVDDLLAACRVANEFNVWWTRNSAADRAQDDNWPLMWAVPVTWPYEAGGHAEALAKIDLEYEWLRRQATRPATARSKDNE